MNTLDDNDSFTSAKLKDDYEYPEWYNKKKYEFYKKIYKRLKLLINIHNESSNYYSSMDKYIFGPSIFITCVSGIASFLSTSQFIDSNDQTICGVMVGVLSSLATLLQSLGSAYRFSAKEEAHRHAAEEYDKLCVKLKFEIEMPNEEDFTDKLEQTILDIQNKCRYFAPQFITDKYQKKSIMIKEKKIRFGNQINPINTVAQIVLDDVYDNDNDSPV
jgi:hypothetical protein